jgi:RHS repeat-associated protein
MAKASGGSGSAIALPQGGGALHGIGEKFSPDLHTGTANFSVPIALPAGRSGFQPQLTLAYSSGTGNGPFGLGWSLSVPGVSRKTSGGVPLYDDERDTFILSGAEDLVPMGTVDGATRYRPRTEVLFARIGHHRAPGDEAHWPVDYWKVESKDGLVSFYGTETPPQRNPVQPWRDPATLGDPADPSRIFAWKLTRTVDPFGNRIEYDYAADAPRTEGNHVWDQRYLREIRYADYGDPASVQFLLVVRFVYEPRPDPFSEYRAGFEIRTVQRCAAVEVYTAAGAETLTRRYELTYLGAQNMPPAPPNGLSLLGRVTVRGYDGQTDETLPPLEFAYTTLDPERRDLAVVSASDLPAKSIADRAVQIVDVDGDGLPDLVEMNGTVRYWRNLGGRRFALPREMPYAPAGLGSATRGAQLIDANGDGQTDLMVVTEQAAGFYPLAFRGLWDERSFRPYRVAPSFDLGDPEVHLVDLDGDGVTDAIRAGERLECFYSDPRDGWTREQHVERRDLDRFPNVAFSDPRVRWADMTGDGLQDIVFIHGRSVRYWPSLGRGRWASPIVMRNAPRLPERYEPRRLLLGDVDGDGAADLVYVDDDSTTLWINQSGNGWSAPITIPGTPQVTDGDAVRILDLLGTGIGGVLWSGSAREYGHAPLWFLDFSGGVKPYLLAEMNNHLGAITRVGYAPSTRDYVRDQERPATRWKTPLPFPVQVVTRVETIDELSQGKLPSEYRYHHGYWDGAEREFRGFGRVDQLDTESFADYHAFGLHDETRGFAEVPRRLFSPPTETRTWFHLGPVGEEFGDWREVDFDDEFWTGDLPALERPAAMQRFLRALPRRVRRDALRVMRGRTVRVELYARDGSEREDRPYTVTEYLHGVAALPATPAPWQEQVFFPHQLAERTTLWERGDDPLTRMKFTSAYDAHGQPRLGVDIAVPRGRDYRREVRAGTPAESYLATYASTTYAQRDDDRYMIDRVAGTTVYEVADDGRGGAGGDRPSLVSLAGRILDGTVVGTVVGQTLHFYDGPAFIGRRFGVLGDYGALSCTESLVLTPEIIDQAYGPSYGAVAPPYLQRDGTTAVLGPEYPPEFQALLPTHAGYVFHAAAAPYSGGYYARTEQRCLDVQRATVPPSRGLLVASRDPLDAESTIEYDTPYDLLPARTDGPTGLITTATYDYRTLKVRETTDPNGARTRYAYTPLGLLANIAVMPRTGEAAGDTPKQPSTVFLYDLRAFEKSAPDARQPAHVHTIRREVHRWQLVDDANAARAAAGQPPLTPAEIDALFPAAEIDPTAEPYVGAAYVDRFVQTREYSDGFGRLLQTRSQADDVLFGDHADPWARYFGDAGLPPDPTSAGVASGRTRSAGDPLNVTVGGWQTYDNKGRTVEKYEPFFSDGWEYLARAGAPGDTFRARLEMSYDARGELVRVVHPDDSEQRIVHGVPGSIARPDPASVDRYEPTPWETYTYDANDNAGRTHPGESAGYSAHWDTPSSALVDALGRVVRATQRNGADRNRDWFSTRTEYDIRGNVTRVTDPLGRVAFEYVYDLTNRAVATRQLDAGPRVTIHDTAGGVVEIRDAKGALDLRAFDALHRPVRLWARDGATEHVDLRERLVYGEQAAPVLNAAGALAIYAAGRLYLHYDEAGLVTFEAYDFKGDVARKARRVISDAQILAVFQQPRLLGNVVPAYRVDWTPQRGQTFETRAAQILDSTVYRTTSEYDALGRVRRTQYPDDVDGAGKILRPHFGRAGALESATLDGVTFVERIAYDAKGQRILVAYGNGVMTRYRYDERTLRLSRMRSERYAVAQGPPLTYARDPNGGPALQELAYAYDLAGNVREIQDCAPGSGVLNDPCAFAISDPQLASLVGVGEALVRRFTYDPLYRLTQATGRECVGAGVTGPWTNAGDPCGFVPDAVTGGLDQANAPQSTRCYTETYDYDPADNLVSLAHTWGPSAGGGRWVRDFGMGGRTPQQWDTEWPLHLNTGTWAAPPGNALTHVPDVPRNAGQTHFYDACGNLARETTSRLFEWDHLNRLRVFREQAQGADPTVHAHYFYEGAGQRVKKLVWKNGGALVETTVYVDGLFEHYRETTAAGSEENDTLHVMDDKTRIATRRVGPAIGSKVDKPVRYHLGDHLRSSNIVTDEHGHWMNREEYYPYGETSYGGFARKQYRFTGMPRDEEHGLSYHGARYYASWLMRWLSCDPGGAGDGLNLFRYARSNPVCRSDVGGTQSSEVELKAVQSPPQLSQAEQQLRDAPYTNKWSLEYYFGGWDYYAKGYLEYQDMIDKGQAKWDAAYEALVAQRMKEGEAVGAWRCLDYKEKRDAIASLKAYTRLKIDEKLGPRPSNVMWSTLRDAVLAYLGARGGAGAAGAEMADDAAALERAGAEGVESEARVIGRARAGETPTARGSGQRAVMGESAASESGRVRDEWLHLQALGLGGPQAAGNLVAGSAQANRIMLVFEQGLMRAVRNGSQVETALTATLRRGTSIGESLRYQAWINGDLVLDATLDLETAEQVTKGFRDFWYRSGR